MAKRLVSMVSVANRSTSLGVIWFLQVVAGHGVEAAMADRPAGLVIFEVADQVERDSG